MDNRVWNCSIDVINAETATFQNFGVDFVDIAVKMCEGKLKYGEESMVFLYIYSNST